MPEPSTPTEGIADILRRKTHVYACGIYDPLTASLAQAAGFDALWLSGFALTASLGLPDNSSMPSRDLVLAARRVTSVAKKPLIVDCDAGYGDADKAVALAADLVSAGVSAISIEDYQHPKVNSFVNRTNASPQLVPAAAFAAKIKRLKEQSGVPFLIARTEALITGESLPVAFFRAAQYVDAGADAILIHSRFRELRDFASISGGWKLPTPLVVVPTNADAVTVRELVDAHFSIVIRANELFRAMAFAGAEAARHLASDGLTALKDRLVSMPDVFRMTGLTHDGSETP